MAVTTFAPVGEAFPEEGTRTLQCAFTDEDGVAVVPNAGTIKWTLTDRPVDRGSVPTVINSREQEDITSASTIYITLSGDDLALLSTETDAYAERLLTVEYEYNSTYGNNLKGKAQYAFQVENMNYVT